MKMQFLSALIIILSALSFSAKADNYFGINYVDVTAEDSGLELSPTALQFTFGGFVNPNFAVEGRFGTGLSEDSVNFLGTDVDFEIENYYGIYLRGVITTGSGFKPYGILGFSKGEIKASSQFGSASESESDLSYGLGADIFFTDTTALNIEYLQAIDKNGVEISLLNLGLKFSF